VSTRPAFRADSNVAIKLPSHQLEAAIAFCRDVLWLKETNI
jgi:hypothetical protein